ncbi:MAG: MBOAT family O-acyltransferase [Ruminococcus callidus]
MLIVFSLLFYACGDISFLWLVVASALVNFVLGRGIDKFRDKTPAKAFLALGLVLNLGTLVGFKYTGFFIENLNHWFSVHPCSRSAAAAWHQLFHVPHGFLSHRLRLGQGQVGTELFTFLLYVSFFPITISGPIARYETMQADLHQRRVSADDLSIGFGRIAVGLGKKVILADRLSGIVDQFLGNDFTTQTTLGVWYGVILYALQMYFDFSGYSDMAIGIARIFGFHLDENFRHPFLCKDITEFWQRWHISLGTFFRDYLLYVPLFGKRRKIGGLLLVWFCTGLWHGASWNYIIWGIYYGLFLMLEMGIGKKGMKKIPAVLRHLCNKIVIIVGFGIFYCTGGIDQLGDMLLAMAGQNGTGWLDTMLVTSVQNNLFLLMAALLCCFPLLELPKKIMAKNPAANVALSVTGTVLAAGLLVISSILMVDATNTPFLYTKF